MPRRRTTGTPPRWWWPASQLLGLVGTALLIVLGVEAEDGPTRITLLTFGVLAALLQVAGLVLLAVRARRGR